MPDAPAPSLAVWLGLGEDVAADALPRTLRADLARAALAADQPALALALTGADAGPEGPLGAIDTAAEALLALGRAGEALALVEARLERSSAIAAVRLQALALLELGDAEGALAAVRALEAAQPDAVSAWGAAGDVALAAGALDEAAAAYGQARELSPRSTAALVGRARVALAQGDVPAAASLLAPLAEEGSAAALATLAEAAAAAGEPERAAAFRARLADRQAALRAVWRARVEGLLGQPEADDAQRIDARGPAPAPLTSPSDGAARDSGAGAFARDATPDSAGVAKGGVAAGPRVRETAGGPATDFGGVTAGGPAPAAPPGDPVATVLPLDAPPSPALLQALGDYFGFEAFRPGQAAVCQAMLDGRDTLAVMPTGAGKSLCFQLPAMLLDGVTLVISPLVALMKDQLDGLPPPVYARATLLNSTLERAELARRVEAVAAGQYRLVYLAPERLSHPALLAALRRASVARVVVDEAHCVSAWGHDFRPDYLTIGDALARLGQPPLLAVTATAPPAVRADVGAGLGRSLAVLQTPLFRPNLRFEVQNLPNVEAKMAALLDLCRAERGSAVVYVNSRQRTEELARLLRNHGVAAAHYHAGLASDERTRVQDAFMLDRTRVIVATVAFGMGVDKANIRLVVHFSLPESLEAYVQESGRAGRDGRPARCVLLTAPADKASLTRWLKAERLSLDDLRAVYRQVKRLLGAEAQGVVDEGAVGLVLSGEDGGETRARVALGLLERAGLLKRLGTVPGEVSVARVSARAVSPGHSGTGSEPPLFAPLLWEDEPDDSAFWEEAGGVTADQESWPSQGSATGPQLPGEEVGGSAPQPPGGDGKGSAPQPPEKEPDAADAARLARLPEAGQRTYGGLALAALLDLPPNELEPWLLDAHEAGWLRYRAVQRGLGVRLDAPPPDATTRLVALLDEYARHQDRRIADIVGYAESLGCRHARIARHFGQRLDPPCGACDRCATDDEAAMTWQSPAQGGKAAGGAPSGAATRGGLAPRPTGSAGEAGAWSGGEPAAPAVPPAAAILGCLAELPFAPGKTGLVRILMGSVAASVGADRTRYHGALRGMTASSVERIVDRLVAEGYLTRSSAQTRDGREFAALGLTPLGRAGPPDWDRLVAPVAATGREQAGTAGRARAAAPGPAVDGEPDPDRFERLRAWRRQEAATSQIAPFMVFADTTLRALAALPPEALDRETLALVPGIGAAKLARYGDSLVALLRDAPAAAETAAPSDAGRAEEDAP